jgi:hypothetical protein
VPHNQPDHVLVRLPDWLNGDKPATLGEMTRWTMNAVQGEAHAWEVHLEESGSENAAELVHLDLLANAGNISGLRENLGLRELAASRGSYPGLEAQVIRDEVSRILEERPGDFSAAMYCVGLSVVSAQGEELAGMIESAMNDVLLPVLPDAAVFQITVEPALSYRMAVIRLLLRVKDDPKLLTSAPENEVPGAMFRSGAELFSDTALGLGAYLAPLFLSLSPWVWAHSSGRSGGVIVFTFGRPIIGRRGEASELLQLFTPRGSLSGGTIPALDPASLGTALQWWVSHLNQLFTEMTDPCHHRTEDGEYDVSSHFEDVLSLEQAFRTVQSLSIHDRDVHVRKGLLFDALDTIAGIRRPDVDEMFMLTKARQALSEIEGAMDESCGDVLLPRANAAIAALDEFQKGFFLPSRIVETGLRVPGKYGDEVISLERATREYLRILRNAGHSFRDNSKGDTYRKDRARALLASHTGYIPPKLPDLAYLYLLRLIARPEDLRRWPVSSNK